MGYKYRYLTYCSLLQPLLIYNFSEIESIYPTSFQDFVTSPLQFCATVSIGLMSPARIFLTRTLVETMSTECYRLCLKSFTDSAKSLLLRLQDSSRNISLNESQGNCFLNFLMLGRSLLIPCSCQTRACSYSMSTQRVQTNY